MSRAASTPSKPRPRLERRVAGVAEKLLDRGGSVSLIDVLVVIGWLPPSTIDRWRQGRVECLEGVAPVTPKKVSAVLEHLRGWAAAKGLTPSEAEYLAATRDRRPLRFTAGGDEATERAWRTIWTRPDVSQAARERTVQRQIRPPDPVVIEPLSEWNCTGCGGTGWLLFMEGPGPLCMDCADLGHLVFLPAGDGALSRRARKASRLSAVVVRFSRSRKRYERQGILVEAVRLAVVASVRHQDTDYDELLMAGLPREVARERVRPDIDRILAAWQQPRSPAGSDD